MARTNLLITGGINHDFDDTADALATVLMNVGIASDIYPDIDAAFEALATRQFDLVTLLTLRWRMLDDDKYIPDRAAWAYEIPAEDRNNLWQHVAGGGGLLGLHTAAICFDTWPEWARLLGVKWVWGRSYHPPPAEISVSRINQVHPATRGLTEFSVVDEIYHHLQPAPGTIPLFSARSEEENIVQPLAWAQTVGDGRVVYDAMGHDRQSVTSEGHARFLQQAAAWCCRSEA